MNFNSNTNQRIKGKFVEREVYACQSMLIDELFRINEDIYDDLSNLFMYEVYLSDGEYKLTEEERQDKIYEIEEEIDKLNEAIVELEWEITDLEFEEDQNDSAHNVDLIESKNLEIEGINNRITDLEVDLATLEFAETETQEIYEWWLVSNFLARKLEKYGEPILRMHNNIWWGRTCTGQAILLDHVISQICSEMGILEGQENEWEA